MAPRVAFSWKWSFSRTKGARLVAPPLAVPLVNPPPPPLPPMTWTRWPTPTPKGQGAGGGEGGRGGRNFSPASTTHLHTAAKWPQNGRKMAAKWLPNGFKIQWTTAALLTELTRCDPTVFVWLLHYTKWKEMKHKTANQNQIKSENSTQSVASEILGIFPQKTNWKYSWNWGWKGAGKELGGGARKLNLKKQQQRGN